MKPVKLCDIVLDYDLYPRREVDSHHVAGMQAAYNAGTEFPPLVLDQKSKRIIDGAHRYKMFKRVFRDTPNHEVDCVLKRYKSERHMFLDAMRYNASHGKNLSSFDRAHCVFRASELGIDTDAVAGALSVTTEHLGKLTIDRKATAGGLTTDGPRRDVQLKRTIRHKAGSKLTDRQVEANDKLSGMHQVFYVNQVIELIESELLNRDDAELMQRIEKLHRLLSDKVLVS